jgi:type II secretory pathway pseudopilin PulG
MPGLVRAMARTAVVAGTATAVSNRVSRRQYGRWEQQAQEQDAQAAYEQQQQAAYQQPPPAAAGEPDYMAELEQLAKLRDQGVVSDEEFEAKKKQLLGI